MQVTDNTNSVGSQSRYVTLLGWAICVLLFLAGWMWDRSSHQPVGTRPILPVLGIYLTACGLAGIALGCLLQSKRPNRMVPIIVVFGMSFRLIQLFSTPFLEIDIYRYLWDGIVVSHGISPYDWSPSQARAEATVLSKNQRAIVELAGSTESTQQIVAQVHFAEYTTIYPPVAQAVFGATMGLVPDSASVRSHLIAMKLVLVGFDVGTMFLLLTCLRVVGRNPVWVTAHAWNPLVIKEIANSGHLDSIAVFFMMAAVLVVVRQLKLASQSVDGDKQQSFQFRSAVLAALFLSCGSGAKLFPIVLLPLFTVWIWHKRRAAACLFAITAAVLTAIVLAPVATEPPTGAKHGLTQFLGHWRMNALVHDVLYENVRLPGGFEPWYSVAPASLRRILCSAVERLPSSLPAPIKVARIVTLTLFGLIYLRVLTRTALPTKAAAEFPRALFHVLVVFLFLQPTVNPWYWVWVIPLACFAKNSCCAMVGAGLLLYYLRFWFQNSGLVIDFAGTRYEQAACFDHIFVWVEYAWFVIGFVAFRFLQARASGQTPEQEMIPTDS